MKCEKCTDGLVGDVVCDACKGTGQVNGEPTELPAGGGVDLDAVLREAFEAGKQVGFDAGTAQAQTGYREGFDAGFAAGLAETVSASSLVADPEEETRRIEAEAEAKAAAAPSG